MMVQQETAQEGKKKKERLGPWRDFFVKGGDWKCSHTNRNCKSGSKCRDNKS